MLPEGASKDLLVAALLLIQASGPHGSQRPNHHPF